MHGWVRGVSALLFAAETHNRLQRDESACTSQLSAWLPPSMKNVKLSLLLFTTGHAGKNTPKKVYVSTPSQAELSSFFSVLAKTGKPALLSIMPEYSDPYVLDYDLLSSISPLSTNFTEDNDLVHKCEALFNNLTVTENQAKNIYYT